MRKKPENVFFCGKRFEVDEEGRLVPVENVSGYSGGKYGEDTVTIRVPVSLMPLLQHILISIEKIEVCRRNIESNVLNTTPELIGVDSLKRTYSEDWRRAVAYAMRASSAYDEGIRKRNEKERRPVKERE